MENDCTPYTEFCISKYSVLDSQVYLSSEWLSNPSHPKLVSDEDSIWHAIEHLT